MVKVVLLDFYGTLVHEAYEFLKEVAQTFQAGGATATSETIQDLWWSEFSAACDSAYGENFLTQKELYIKTFSNMARITGAKIDILQLQRKVIDFSLHSSLMEDTRPFLEKCPFPYYIVSNIDTKELQQIIRLHRLQPKDIYTSEEAREYKPRSGIFKKGLQKFGYSANEALYVGDSLRNDYFGASGAGISAIWLNRRNAAVPTGVKAVSGLMQLLPILSEEI